MVSSANPVLTCRTHKNAPDDAGAFAFVKRSVDQYPATTGPASRLKYRIAFRRLGRHTRLHDRFLRRYPKIPRRLKRTPDVRILGAAIESDQLHAMRALHLITVAEAWRPLAERPVALGTQNFYSVVGHEIFPQFLIGEDYANPLFFAPDDTATLTFIAAQDVQRDFVGNHNRTSYVERRSDRGHVTNYAIDATAVELNRSGLKDPFPLCCAPLIHFCPF
jgi:hypothetical protein